MENEIVIDEDVPLPEIRMGRLPIYPLGKLKIDNSFAVDWDKKKAMSICSCISYYGKRHSKKFQSKVRFEKDSFGKEKKVIRIWRIE